MRTSVACALLVTLSMSPAGAQSVMPGVDEMAKTITEMTTKRWVGPRVDFPAEQTRPGQAELWARSSRAPVALHVAPSVDSARANALLRALEFAHDALLTDGWTHPMPDGGLGETAAFDLYAVVGAPATEASVDARANFSYLDRASTFAIVDARLPESRLVACVTHAYASAILLALDPAESPRWRRESAAYITRQATGESCERSANQTHARDGWLSAHTQAGQLLAALSARHDRTGSAFVRDLWDLASQRTWEGEGLRASPDLWMAIETVLRLAGDPLDNAAPDFAAQRYFTPQAPPVEWHTKWIALPTRSPPIKPLGAYGTAYLRVHTAGHTKDAVLHTWLIGEFGVRWSITALRLDKAGAELGRVSATTTPTAPKAYLPVELDAATYAVVLVVTNLSNALPDEDTPDTAIRAFQVALDVE